MASKIIVLGSVDGQLESAFAKLSTLNLKNSFTFALITGNLFSEDDALVTKLLAGDITVPIPTYFTIGTKELPKRVVDKLCLEQDLCENLHYLGKRSTTRTSEGVRIVALGGILSDEKAEIVLKEEPGGAKGDQVLKEPFSPFHTIADARSLRGAKSADILLTATWPSSIRLGSAIALPESFIEPTIYQHIASLDVMLKPRYHFCCSPDMFYEREPFFHPPPEDASNERHLTRFISLAAHGNSAKQKSLYAFSLPSSVDLTLPLPSGATASPFKTGDFKKRPALGTQPYSRFADNGDYQGKRGGRRNKRPPPGPDECFFCLSNPNLPTHMVASIGDDAYLTIAKGPLTTATTNADSNIHYPAHMLIIPLTHEPTLAQIDLETRSKTFEEMNRYKAALQDMLATRSSNTLGAVTYEISRGRGVHTHWQLYPMPVSLIRKGLVEAAFKVEAENMQYPAFDNRDVALGEGEGDFFRVWIWAPATEELPGPTIASLNMPIPDDLRFDLQFGRRVLAKLLGLEKRLQWRDCEQTEAEETSDCTAFKVAFKEFDFSLQ